MRHLIILASLLLIISNASAQMSFSQGLTGKYSDSKDMKRQNIPSEVTVSWAKQALQGFKMRVWISNQMAMGLQAWDCTMGACIPQEPFFGLEYPIQTFIEHLYGAGPWIGAKIDNIVRVTEGYNGSDARKEILPIRSDTLRERIWITSLDSLIHPNKKGIDDDNDGLIDEDELDGTDNDGDWNPITDDLGTDGLPDTLEVGCTGVYDPVTNPDPSYDNYDPSAYDNCRLKPDSTHPMKSDKNRYTEKNGIADHGEPNVDEDFAARSDRDIYTMATDTFHSPVISGHVPMGVKVFQKSYAWKTPINTEAFIIQEYDISNISRKDWMEVSMGLFADMDIGVDYNIRFYDLNYVSYDSATRTAYTHNPVERGVTPLGITFLGSSLPLDTFPLVFRWYDFTTHLGPGTYDSLIYLWMNCNDGISCIDPNQSPDSLSDPKVYLGLSRLTLHPGEVIKLYYGIVSGYTIEGMLDNARLAQSVYDSVYTLDIENQRSILPKSVSLNQNYPNPFNPSTQITFSVPKATVVTLKIYDLLGREVALLVNERKPAGEYTLNWNAAGLPSGVYFYRIVAGEFVQTKKMVVIR